MYKLLSCLLWLAVGSARRAKSGGLRKTLLIAGNFTINDEVSNIAQFDLNTGLWYPQRSAQIYLYGEDNNGIIWDLAVNTSDPYGEAYAVGLFDTGAKMSQIQLCSVASFDGRTFDKVGEGLCSRGGDLGPIIIKNIVVGSDGDLFVGGNFATRVWDGHHFVYVYHIARFDAKSTSWLPLHGGGELRCRSSGNQTAQVNSILWEKSTATLYLAGSFHAVDDRPLSSGLAMWTATGGLVTFPGGGLLSDQEDDNGDSSGSSSSYGSMMIYEPVSQTLIVAGSFSSVGSSSDPVPCRGLALFNRQLKEWKCLFTADNNASSSSSSSSFSSSSSSFSSSSSSSSSSSFFEDSHVSAMALGGGFNLFIAGPVAHSTGGGPRRYSVAVLDLQPYVIEVSKRLPPPSSSSSSTPNNNSSNSTNSHVSNEEKKRHRRHRRRLRHIVLDNNNHLPVVSNMGNQSHSPSAAPTVFIPSWTPQWSWLPSFPGAPLGGSIIKLTAGGGGDRDSETESDFGQALFMSIDYSDSIYYTADMPPAIIAWNLYPHRAGYAYGNYSYLGGARHSNNPVGQVMQMAMVNFNPDLPHHDSNDNNDNGNDNNDNNDNTNPALKRDYTFVILLACVGVGILMGLCFTISCSPKIPVNTADDDDLFDGENDSNGFHRLSSHGNNHNRNNSSATMISGISLLTLTDNGSSGGAAVDFKECFERAMKIRHLPTYETLVIINPKEILLAKIVGEGSFGRVWSGQWRNNSVAVKEFVFAQAAIAGGSLQRNNIIDEIVGEAGVMACLRHPKILQLYGCSLTMQAIWIVSELCVRGSLKMILADQKLDLSILKKLSIAMDIADGMSYLHNRNPPIIHRDLKSHNIFIAEPSPGHFIAKIGDWGSARAIALTAAGAKSMTQGVGTACWLSPEVINNAHFSKSSDVYAFGIILWEVFTRQEIYEGLSAAQIIAKVANEGLRPQVPRDCPWSAIMTQCWKQEPVERPGFDIVLAALSKVYVRYTARATQRRAHAVAVANAAALTAAGSSGTGIARVAGAAGVAAGGAEDEEQSNDSLRSLHSDGSDSQRSGSSGTFWSTNTSGAYLKQPITSNASPRGGGSGQELQQSTGQQVTETTGLLSLSSSDSHLYPPLSPAKRSGRQQQGRGAYESFHPSLENIVQPRQRSNESLVSHLAPELAQMEAALGIWPGQAQDPNPPAFFVVGVEDGDSMLLMDEGIEEPIEAGDILFGMHSLRHPAAARSVRQQQQQVQTQQPVVEEPPQQPTEKDSAS